MKYLQDSRADKVIGEWVDGWGNGVMGRHPGRGAPVQSFGGLSNGRSLVWGLEGHGIFPIEPGEIVKSISNSDVQLLGTMSTIPLAAHPLIVWMTHRESVLG